MKGTAQVTTDASLHVTEQRAFSFDESYSAIEWNIPGTEIGSSVDVSGVRALRANKEGKSTGKWRAFKDVPFNPSWRDLILDTGGCTQEMKSYFDKASVSGSNSFVTKPKARTYSFDASNDSIYIFPKAVSKNTVYECSYTISNAARVYDDVAELYWTYCLPAGDDVAKDIHMKIQLPVPEDATVHPNSNVYAWGHGPAGTVDVRADGVIDIKVPLVKPGQYSMVHIVFPRNWLKNVDMRSESYKTGTRLGYALSEEEDWTDVHSAHKINAYAVGIGLCALGLIALVFSVVAYLVFGRERRSCGNDDEPDSDEVSCTDLISEWGPAVCGRLLRWNRHSAYDLAYVLQSLIEKGVVQVSVSSDVGKIRFRLSPSSKSTSLDEVEQGALFLIFETIGDGYQSISIDDIKGFCEKDPDLAFEAMSKWQKLLSKRVEESNLFDAHSRRASHVVYAVAAIMAIIGLAALISGCMIWGCIVDIVTSIICALIAYNIPRRTPNGVLLAEKLESLKPFQTQNRPDWEVPFANAFGGALTA